MKHLAICDVHTHLRGLEYDADYMRMAKEDAEACGICHLIEMPNPKPWLTTPELLAERHKRWLDMGSSVGHGVHIGLTTDKEQVTKALQWCRSDKVFYSHSTGLLGILDPDMQRWIWGEKQRLGYTGVSIGHFEDEKRFGYCGVKFDPADPVSHSLYQNEDAEVFQVNRQLDNAAATGFRGTFYIAHVSSHDTIHMVKQWRQTSLPFRIAIEITWHHMLLNFDDYKYHANGNMMKCNPPLRSKRTQEALLDHVLRGDIDVIATDHAPHPQSRKNDPVAPASGVPGLPFWPRGIELLRHHYHISKQLLDNLTFHNANRIFDLGLKPVEVETRYDIERWGRYGYNPFARIY